MEVRMGRFSGHIAWALAFLAMMGLFAPENSFGNILVDDFTEVTDPSPYPIIRNFPSGGGPNEGPLTTTIGDIRSVFAAAGPTIPPPNPLPSDLSLTVDIDPALGQLTSNASADSTTLLILFWVNELATPMNVDISGMSELVIDYASVTANYDLTVTLSNLQPGTTTTTAANEGKFTLLAGTNGQLHIDLDDINDPVQIPLQPAGTFYPPLDKTSLDLVFLEFETTTLDGFMALDKIQFVPEPSSASLLLAGLAAVLVRRKLQSVWQAGS